MTSLTSSPTPYERRAMGRRGLNPKDWYYGFKRRIVRDPEKTARVLCGPAAERWLAGEFYAYLAEHLPDTYTCWGEDETTDLTVYRTAEADGAWKEGRVASIELKVVYRHYGYSNAAGRVQHLCHQVMAAGPNGDCPLNVGILFGVFVRRPNKTFRQRRTLGEFRRGLLRIARPICTESGVPLAKPTFETSSPTQRRKRTNSRSGSAAWRQASAWLGST